MVKNYFEGKAVKKLLNSLGPELKARYGKQSSFTKGQVDATVDKLQLDKKYIYFAYFVFGDESTYADFQFKAEEIERYERLKETYQAGGCGGCGSNVADASCGEGSCGD